MAGLDCGCECGDGAIFGDETIDPAGGLLQSIPDVPNCAHVLHVEPETYATSTAGLTIATSVTGMVQNTLIDYDLCEGMNGLDTQAYDPSASTLVVNGDGTCAVQPIVDNGVPLEDLDGTLLVANDQVSKGLVRCDDTLYPTNGLGQQRIQIYSQTAAGAGSNIVNGNVQTLFPLASFPTGVAHVIPGSEFTFTITNPSTCFPFVYKLDISGFGMFPARAAAGGIRPLFMAMDMSIDYNGGGFTAFNGNTDAAINWTSQTPIEADQQYTQEKNFSGTIAPGGVDTISVRKLVIFPDAARNDRAAYEVGHEQVFWSYFGSVVML